VSPAGSASRKLAALNSVPAPPANVAAAAAATQVGSGAPLLLTAPATDAVQTRISEALKPTGSVAGIDISRASSDPAYAAQIQARMQTMSTAEKMAMVNQMAAAQRASAGDPASTAAIAGFVGGQRSADMAAQQKIRSLLEGALASTGAKHRAIDDALNKAAKACPTDKTGWPLDTCTGPLGTKSIAQHRAIENASLGAEGQALTQARAIALAEMSKGRDLLAHASGTSAISLSAWAMAYVQMLNDYAKAMTLRAGFWAHADASKYTGLVTAYIRAPGGEIYWPLKDAAYGSSIGTGL
jgi:hypothetical protein